MAQLTCYTGLAQSSGGLVPNLLSPLVFRPNGSQCSAHISGQVHPKSSPRVSTTKRARHSSTYVGKHSIRVRASSNIPAEVSGCQLKMLDVTFEAKQCIMSR